MTLDNLNKLDEYTFNLLQKAKEDYFSSLTQKQNSVYTLERIPAEAYVAVCQNSEKALNGYIELSKILLEMHKIKLEMYRLGEMQAEGI